MTKTDKLSIQSVAILGSGVMGTQIAAHFSNAGFQPILFDLPSENDDPNALVKQAIKDLISLKPNPLVSSHLSTSIIPANYKTDLDLLRTCDLIIEAISERIDWKRELYHTIMPYLHQNVILATNTSGLSIKMLSDQLPDFLKARFCGIHFFNPPRYMKLVELIPHELTGIHVLHALEHFLVVTLGKGVIYAKDTPNFIANRIGIFSILSLLHHADIHRLMPDVVDALTGTLIGRPTSATFRTLDVVGLDTFAHVVNTQNKGLKTDPWHDLFKLPSWMNNLIEKGAVGQKSGVGIYKKQGKDIFVIDPIEGSYRIANKKINPKMEKILLIEDPKHRFQEIIHSSLNEAKFLWGSFCDLFHYSAYHLESIADTVRDVDLALRWGYAWSKGPFETWQTLGWSWMAKEVQKTIDQGLTTSKIPLPKWVFEIKGDEVYQNSCAYSPAKKSWLPRSTHPVYQRQLFQEAILNDAYPEGLTRFETSSVRLWTLDGKIAILNFKSKKNTVTVAVLEGILEALKIAEKDYEALVLWQNEGADFSFGANLADVLSLVKAKNWEGSAHFIRLFQKTSLALYYASIPTIAAVQGVVLGGGCELMMHTSRVVAAMESYIGLVEIGVGIIPAGGGCKEFARRAFSASKSNKELFSFLEGYFNLIAKAETSTSAWDAKEKGFLRDTDIIIMNSNEILSVAIQLAKTLAYSNYRKPIAYPIKASGRSSAATLKGYLINLREGEFISDHDFLIGSYLADTLCGGRVEGLELMDEKYWLELELHSANELLKTKKTEDRIEFMLKNGKPLRN